MSVPQREEWTKPTRQFGTLALLDCRLTPSLDHVPSECLLVVRMSHALGIGMVAEDP
jgi:hypothetical protein